MIGIGLGIFMSELVQKELEPINKTRVAAGLKPYTPFQYFDASKDLGDLKGKEYSKAVMQKLTANTKAEIAALKALPKGTLTNAMDDAAQLAGKVGGPIAAAAAVGMEALRRRKNANAAQAAQADAMDEYMQYKYGFKTPKFNPNNPASKTLENSAQTITSRAKGWAKNQLGPAAAATSAGLGFGTAFNEEAANYLDWKQSEKIPASPMQRNEFGEFVYPPVSSATVEAMKAYGHAVTEPSTWQTGLWRTMDFATNGALTRNEEYNRLSGLDGNLSLGEQAGNFAKSVVAIPLDFLSGGMYDAKTIGPKFSPNYTSIKEFAENTTTNLTSGPDAFTDNKL
jgi:hypothetical protein